MVYSLRALGRRTQVPERADFSLLEAVPRGHARGAAAGWPDGWAGVDLWRAHEVSWLGAAGLPEVAVAHIEVPARSPNIVESKSLKLALNAINFTRFADLDAVRAQLAGELAKVVGAPVAVHLYPPWAPPPPPPPLRGICLERPAHGQAAGQAADRQPATPAGRQVHYSHLLRSLCPVTQQPDWGTVIFSHRGGPIDRSWLMQRVVGLRRHPGFHEALVEDLFAEIWRAWRPAELTVQAMFTARGGIDINPVRTSHTVTDPLYTTFRRPG